MLVQLCAQALHEPRALSGVPPRVKAWYRRIGDEEIGMAGNLVAHGGPAAVRLGAALQRHAAIQLVALTRLDKEQLRFSSQSWTAICREWAPNVVQLVLDVLGVDVAQLTVGQDCNQDAIVVRVVHCSVFLDFAVNLF